MDELLAHAKGLERQRGCSSGHEHEKTGMDHAVKDFTDQHQAVCSLCNPVEPVHNDPERFSGEELVQQHIGQGCNPVQRRFCSPLDCGML